MHTVLHVYCTYYMYVHVVHVCIWITVYRLLMHTVCVYIHDIHVSYAYVATYNIIYDYLLNA